MWNSFQSTFYFETAEPNCFCVHVFVSVYRTASHATQCLSFRWLTSALDDTWVLIKRASCAWRPTTWCWDIWTILRRRREHWMRTAGFIQVRGGTPLIVKLRLLFMKHVVTLFVDVKVDYSYWCMNCCCVCGVIRRHCVFQRRRLLLRGRSSERTH